MKMSLGELKQAIREEIQRLNEMPWRDKKPMTFDELEARYPEAAAEWLALCEHEGDFDEEVQTPMDLAQNSYFHASGTRTSVRITGDGVSPFTSYEWIPPNWVEIE